MMKIKTVGIVGTGPAALMAGTIILENGNKVVFFDHKKSPGRKFLVAGNGGFNLTNNEELKLFLSRYEGEIIKKAVSNFTNTDFRTFLLKIGIETYVGSSGKIFPLEGIKPIDVLRNWKNYLLKLGASFEMEHTLVDFQKNTLIFEHLKEKKIRSFDNIVFALGGGSWSKTGSDGKWLKLFQEKGIVCSEFGASNSGFVLINHQEISNYSGQIIKNCKVYSVETEKMGDIVISDYGVEGAPIYALNGSFRKGIPVYLDFKPTISEELIRIKLEKAKNTSEGLKELKLAKVAIEWIRSVLNKEQYLNSLVVSSTIKRFEFQIEKLRPVSEVISTIGGVKLEMVTDSFELKSFPNTFCIGEMIDWDAPTGGYLIQACVSSGYITGKSISSQS